MQGVIPSYKTEVLYGLAIPCDRLGSNARWARLQVLGPKVGYESIERLAEELLAERPAQFVEAHARVFLNEAPESAVGQRIKEVSGGKIGFLVPSRDNASTAFGPASMPPWISRVK